MISITESDNPKTALIDQVSTLEACRMINDEDKLVAAAVEKVLRKSGELADLEVVARSWFEDDPETARAIASARGRNRAKLATYLLQSVMARHRDKWTDLLLRTTLWMREAPPEFDLCWRELAIVAKALADGRDMTEIGLMRDIAQRTVAVLTNGTRM
jgi:DNA-binding NarL/FixJ family response regulator